VAHERAPSERGEKIKVWLDVPLLARQPREQDHDPDATSISAAVYSLPPVVSSPHQFLRLKIGEEPANQGR
jgi:hypothetical protein